MSTSQTVVIAGAGPAGAKAAEMREEGFGRIVLLGAERQRPCERPPLSKEYLRDERQRRGRHGGHPGADPHGAPVDRARLPDPAVALGRDATGRGS